MNDGPGSVVELNDLFAPSPAPVVDETRSSALIRAKEAADAGRYGEAAGICDDLLEDMPDEPEVLAVLGSVRGNTGRYAEGISLLERAVAQKADVATWWAHLCLFNARIGRSQAARLAGGMATTLNPNSPDFFVNLAIAHRLSDVPAADEEILTCLLRALAIDPDHARAHMGMGEHLLACGDMEAGWREYAWRKHLPYNKRYSLPSAEWTGYSLPNGRIIVIAEGGYGDVIQFSRYIPCVAERCESVVLGCPPELVPLFWDWPGRIPNLSVVSAYEDMPPHAAHVDAMDLPGLFHPTTTLNEWPYITANSDRVALWHSKVREAAPSGSRRIGICWHGSSTHPNDYMRSMRYHEVISLLLTEGCEFFTLQMPAPEDPKPKLALADWGDTAAVVSQLDLVITVDTAVAHLAGAMGVPTWVMLSKHAEWRWLDATHDTTPWYQTMALFRARDDGWAEVVGRVKERLECLCRFS